MKFDDENLSESEFENLDVFHSQRPLGISVQGFAKGLTAGVMQSLNSRHWYRQVREQLRAL